MKAIVLMLSCFVFFSCESNSNKQSNIESKNTHQSDTSNIIIQSSSINEVDTFELLQGKWQHIDDSSNYLIFDGVIRKEISEGMEEWDEEEFYLANNCLNESNKDNEKNGAKFISIKKSDLCWQIIEINDENLSLSYLGRGNTLNYKKVK